MKVDMVLQSNTPDQILFFFSTTLWDPGPHCIFRLASCRFSLHFNILFLRSCTIVHPFLQCLVNWCPIQSYNHFCPILWSCDCQFRSGEVPQPSQLGLHLMHLDPAGLLHQVLSQLPSSHQDQPGRLPCWRRDVQLDRIFVLQPQRDDRHRLHHQWQGVNAPLQGGGGSKVSQVSYDNRIKWRLSPSASMILFRFYISLISGAHT